MIALDTNILVYAHREDCPHHAKAKEVVTDLAGTTGSFAIPWPCVHEFLAVVTHPRIYVPPSPPGVAIAAIDALTSLPQAVLLAEGPGHWDLLRDLVTSSGTTGPRVHDARIAAICIAHGVRELWSADRDFSWFPALRVVNPLTG